MSRVLTYTSDPIRELGQLIRDANLKVSFSANCHSGFVGRERCECWRCREWRGVNVDGFTEEAAAFESRRLQLKQREELNRWWKTQR